MARPMMDLASILDDLPIAVWVGKAPDGATVYTNRAFERILGVPVGYGLSLGVLLRSLAALMMGRLTKLTAITVSAVATVGQRGISYVGPTLHVANAQIAGNAIMFKDWPIHRRIDTNWFYISD